MALIIYSLNFKKNVNEEQRELDRNTKMVKDGGLPTA